MLKPKITRKNNIVTIVCTSDKDAEQCHVSIEKAMNNPLARAAMKAQAKKMMRKQG